MSYKRIAVAGLVGTVVFYILGGIIFGWAIAGYYAPYTDVYRPAQAVMGKAAIGMASTLVAMMVLTFMYAKGYEGGNGALEGARFGFLVGFFIVFAVVADEYVTLNIGGRLAAAQAVGRLIEWTITGIAIGLIYKPRK